MLFKAEAAVLHTFLQFSIKDRVLASSAERFTVFSSDATRLLWNLLIGARRSSTHLQNTCPVVARRITKLGLEWGIYLESSHVSSEEPSWVVRISFCPRKVERTYGASYDDIEKHVSTFSFLLQSSMFLLPFPLDQDEASSRL